jgi:hypothetical protein
VILMDRTPVGGGESLDGPAGSGPEETPMSATPEWFQITVVMCIVAVVFVPLLLGLFLMIRDTRRGYGRWGINREPIYCPRCDEPAPTVRVPANWRQMLWGGVTCRECGCEYDKWGKPIEVAPEFDPSPFRPSPRRPKESRPGPSDDIQETPRRDAKGERRSSPRTDNIQEDSHE